MVNTDCQTHTFPLDDNLHYLQKMSSSTNLYDYLTHSIAFKSSTHHFDMNNNNDDERLLTSSPTVMTNSDSSDSAIMSDETDDFEFSNYYSWAKPMEQQQQSRPTSISSLSQSFQILNQLKLDKIYETPLIIGKEKYKRPLPWINSPSQTSSTFEIPLNKVFK